MFRSCGGSWRQDSANVQEETMNSRLNAAPKPYVPEKLRFRYRAVRDLKKIAISI